MNVRRRMMASSFLTGLCLAMLLSCLSAVAAAADADLPDPQALGPYPVGVTTLTLVDASRTDPATKGPRTLLTEIWYPAGDEAKDLPKNKFSDFILRGQFPMLRMAIKQQFKIAVEEFDAKFQNIAVRDARIRDGKYPLLVFSHGNGGFRNQSTFWCDYMASHGYIIMSADHTGNSAFTVVDGKVVPQNNELREQSAEDRPKDVSFLIDQMTKMSKGTDSRFNGRVDIERIGVAGHSFGGFTSIHVINSDPRVDAIIPMTPVWRERTNYTTPVLMMIGTEDKTIGLQGNEHARQYFEESKGPRYLVELPRGGHFTWCDMEQINPNYGDGIGRGVMITQEGKEIDFLPAAEAFKIINAYSVAFFGVYVKGEAGYGAFLNSNPYGDQVIHKAAVPETPGGGSE